MKILYLTARQPYPYTKGDQLISYHQIKELSKNHNIYLISFYEDFYQECYGEMSKYCEEMLLIKNSSVSKLFSSLKTIANFNSIQSNLFYKVSLNKKFHDMYNRIQPDVVHVLTFRMAQYFINDDIFKSIGLVDSYSHNMLIRAEKTRGILKYLWKFEYKLLKAYEIKVLKHYKYATIVSERDKQLLPFKEIVVNPVGVKVDSDLVEANRRLNDETKDNALKILFQGNMSYYPNVNAVRFIVNRVLPLLEDNINYKLYIVGGSPSNEIVSMANEKIVVTGYVKDMEEYLGLCDVAIYPIFEATGMQTKILEAMAAELPCIISEACLKGIKGLNDGENVLVANNEEVIADSIKDLIANKELKDRITRNAKELISSQYSWDNNINNLLKIWEKADEDTC